MRPDFIIVGAGSSGCAIARRITERSDRSVLLLEAGPDYFSSGSLPIDLTDSRRNSMRAHDWGYHHKPNSLQRVFPFPRGRVVGGSSAVNTCVALRGQPQDFDEWNAFAPEWSWQRCLPAFKRLERDLDMPDPTTTVTTGPCRSAAIRGKSKRRFKPRSSRPVASSATPTARTATARTRSAWVRTR